MQLENGDKRTYFIDHGVAIGETAGGAAVEVDAVGEVVGLGKRREVVVVAVVDEGVPEHEHRRHRISPSASAPPSTTTNRCYVLDHLLPYVKSGFHCFTGDQGYRQQH